MSWGPLTGSDAISIRSFLADLTYAEVHAATVGVMHATGIFVSIVLALEGVPLAGELAIGLTVAAFALLGWTSGEEAREIRFVTRILQAIPAWLRGQIRAERHYYGGFGIGAFIVELLFYVGLNIGLVPGF